MTYKRYVVLYEEVNFDFLENSLDKITVEHILLSYNIHDRIIEITVQIRNLYIGKQTNN